MDFHTSLAVPLAGVLVAATFYLLRHWRKKSNLRQKMSAKQKRCREAFHQLAEHLEEYGVTKVQEGQIVSLRLVKLVERLRSGELTAVDVLKAYQAKALEVNKLFNCLVEPLLDAEKLAEASDRKMEGGLLEGVPVSFKENIFIQGYESSVGMAVMLGKPAKDDSVLLKVLRHQGAIPYMRTNLSYATTTFESTNPLFGRTLNPHDVLRSPGGSSGGEGALLAAGGSIVGFGNDIGGSVRIPALITGDSEDFDEANELVQNVSSPMARDVAGLALTLRALLCPCLFQLEPSIPPVPFRTEIFESTRPLRIGYYTDDGYLRCIPAIERAVLDTKVALERRGHTLVPFSVPRGTYSFTDLFARIQLADGAPNFRDLMANDVVDDAVRMQTTLMNLPRFVLKLLAPVVSFITKDPVNGRMVKAALGVDSVSDWWKLADELGRYKKEFLAQWKACELDAVICPGLPYAAVPNGGVENVVGGATYVVLYNVLNYPAGVVPVTKVTAEDQENMKDYPTTRMAEKFIKQYFSEGSVGLPVGVQCAALPFQEEMVLRVMKEIEESK